MELDNLVYELACLHEPMLFYCEDRSGKEDPVFAHYCMALGRIVRGLEETERHIRAKAANAESHQYKTPRRLPPGRFYSPTPNPMLICKCASWR